MRKVRTEEEIVRRQELANVRKVKLRALQALDRQKLPPDQKCYNADAGEISAFLDAGADILEHSRRKNYTLLRLMYEGIPIKYEAQNEFTHPRLK